jgi:CRISPR/Cas system-associated exonuclease Cas4 (RecB family)
MRLPEPQHATVPAIFAWHESRADDGLRAHLGASLIGHPCERYVWQSFRWIESQRFDGRMLRLFNRGKREEAPVVEELRGIGCEVHADDGTGQYRVSAHGGHFGGSLDGVLRGLPEAPRTWHLLEIKTHSAKSFADLRKQGVRASKPQHFDQMQAYMHLAELPRALYFAVNKDTDELHVERIEHDKAHGEALLTKARRLIEADAPPPRINGDPAWWICKGCQFREQCHGTAAPLVNCRTCLHATPVLDGEAGEWTCAHYGEPCSEGLQREGCSQHRYIPVLLQRFAEPIDADEKANTVTYRNTATGAEFVNGDVSSAEIRALADKRMLGQERIDPTIRELRDEGATYAG